MVSTSLGMVGTPEALLWGPQRGLLHRRATRDWKSESVTDLPTDGLTNGVTWVGARDTCVSKKLEIWYRTASLGLDDFIQAIKTVINWKIDLFYKMGKFSFW